MYGRIVKDFEIWVSKSSGVFRTYTAVAGTWKTIPEKLQMMEDFFCEMLKASVRGLH